MNVKEYLVTWRAVLPGGEEVMRANRLLASRGDVSECIRAVERWALTAAPTALRRLDLVTWSLDDGSIVSDLGFRLRPLHPTTALPPEPKLALKIAWQARWTDGRVADDRFTARATYTELDRYLARVERLVRRAHPERLERLCVTVYCGDGAEPLRVYEAGKERVARPRDDVFLAIQSDVMVDHGFRHFVAFPSLADAQRFVEELADEEHGWTVERIDRERYEHGDPSGWMAARSVISRGRVDRDRE